MHPFPPCEKLPWGDNLRVHVPGIAVPNGCAPCIVVPDSVPGRVQPTTFKCGALHQAVMEACSVRARVRFRVQALLQHFPFEICTRVQVVAFAYKDLPHPPWLSCVVWLLVSFLGTCFAFSLN